MFIRTADMLRLHVRFSGLLLLLLGVLMLLIRAQPYDDHEIRALLLPDDCTMPCFMGIRPGVTSIDDAVRLLENHAWVKQVARTGMSVQWFWNGREPAFLEGTIAPSLSAIISDGLDTNVVGAMYIPTHLPTGFIYLLMQNPTTFRIDPSNTLLSISSAHYVYLSVSFGSFDVGAAIACPTRLNNFWSTSGLLSILSRQDFYNFWTVWDRQKLRKIMYHDWGCP
jgi:hypothetical protein